MKSNVVRFPIERTRWTRDSGIRNLDLFMAEADRLEKELDALLTQNDAMLKELEQLNAEFSRR